MPPNPQHAPCPRCQSTRTSAALSVEGWTYCESCGYIWPAAQVVAASQGREGT